MREAAAQLAARKEASHIAQAGYEEPETETAADEEDSVENRAQTPRADVEESLARLDGVAPREHPR